MAYYSSFGAAGEVTGSCHLLTIDKINILIDCGMFQGEESELNFEAFPFDPKDINYLIVTHAHLDHIGRIPLLVREGFEGKIISTRATAEIAHLMLRNSAGILETKKEKLYTSEDAEKSLEYFGTYLECNDSMILLNEIKISFKNAGHILGAVSVKIEFEEDNLAKSVIFSGDIGQHKRVITAPIEFWDEGNYIFLESTYGSSLHQELKISVDKFKEEILNTLSHGGTVVIPSFALERTQEVLFLLRQMSLEGSLKNIPVYLDSPLAINVTRAFGNYPNLFSPEVMEIIQSGDNPFEFDELINTYSKQESQTINEHEGSKIIIAGSGMCEGGRVNYHLIRYISEPKNLVLFVGFQVRSTLGEKISSGNKQTEILGVNVDIRANITFISGFSAHADQKELIEWIEYIKDVYCVYLIHGETVQLKTLKEKIKEDLQEKVHIVKMKERIYL